MPLRAACIQVTSGVSMDKNVDAVARLVREAHAQGAEFVFLPENVGLLGPGAVMREGAAFEEKHRALSEFKALASQLGLWILVGSLAVKRPDGRLANRSYLIDSLGKIIVRYDKIHSCMAT